jgi:hypothetical protein
MLEITKEKNIKKNNMNIRVPTIKELVFFYMNNTIIQKKYLPRII